MQPVEPSHDDPLIEESERRLLESERFELLEHVARWLETPMIVLGFVWLGLLVAELIWGISSGLERAGLIIWGIFVLDFLLEFLIAPRKLKYLARNWLTALSLVIPAFRVLRLARILRAARGLRLFRVVSSLNRGMRALGGAFQRRGAGYVVVLTLVVTFAGAAGMFAFEREVEGGFHNYGEALWWTAMIMTTMGSAYWPQSVEGRILCLFLALYAFGIFGYVTATLASFFVGNKTKNDQ